MPKNIVLLSDGTGNSSAQLMKTNVWRLYESLKLDDPSRQVACYDDGVGTSGFKPLAILGGALGAGLKRNVLRLYRFLCEHYEPGDHIYLFGFSRGAFTVRVLNGLICDQGIIKTPRSGIPRTPSSEPEPPSSVFGAELARRTRWAYREFRKQFNQAGVVVAVARMLRDVVFRSWEAGKRRYDKDDNYQVDSIRFIGVWDTVDAYGLPVDELTAGIDRWVWPLSMPDLELPRQVKKACHVLALDDERNTFHPVLWDERGERMDSTNIHNERLTQVWFAGMHSNVGGGYADDSLSSVSLKWMTDQVLALPPADQLLFSPQLLSHHIAKQDALGRIYDSRSGLKAYYRYNPRRIEWLTNGLAHETRFYETRPLIARVRKAWDDLAAWVSHKIFRRPPIKDPTVSIPFPKIHASVFRRIAAAPEAYAPIVLPEQYVVVDEEGAIHPAEEFEAAGARARRVRSQETAWNLVWWRRAVYFTAVGLTAILLLRPFSDEAIVTRGQPPSGLPGRTVAALGDMLPGVVSPVIDYYAAAPTELLALLLPILILSRIGRRLQARICSRMRRIWLRTTPPPGTHLGQLAPAEGALYRLRSSDLYQATFALLRRRVFPTITGIAALLWLAGAINRASFEAANLSGLICQDAGESREVPVNGELTFKIEAKEACNPTGVVLKQGEQYQIVVNEEKTFKDASIPANFPHGYSTWSDGLSLGQRAVLTLAAPFRRSWLDRWFALTARVGRRGADYYALRKDTSLTAQTSGPLFVFVNDAVLPVGPGPLGWKGAYYDNNHGVATLRIKHWPLRFAHQRQLE